MRSAGRRNPLWRRPIGDQGRLRRISTFPRDRQADWFSPGYLGHRETHPLINQEELAKSHTDKLKLSFLLFDEMKRPSDSLWAVAPGHAWIRLRDIG